MPDILVEWITKHLDEEEALISTTTAPNWHSNGGFELRTVPEGSSEYTIGPARILIEIVSKRQLLEVAATMDKKDKKRRAMLKSLALPYADREGYREVVGLCNHDVDWDEMSFSHWAMEHKIDHP